LLYDFTVGNDFCPDSEHISPFLVWVGAWLPLEGKLSTKLTDEVVLFESGLR
jgi:hypothetical protein